MSDIDRMFITVNANRSGPTNPSNSIIEKFTDNAV